MKTKTILLTIAGLSLTTALMANGPQDGGSESCGEHRGQGMHRSGEHRMGAMHRGQRRGFMRQIGRQLDLTQDQRRKIRQIFREAREKAQAARKTYQETGKKQGRLNPESYMSAEHFDKEAFKRGVLEQQAKRKAARQARRQVRLDRQADRLEKIFNILTPEQRRKWIQLSKGKKGDS